MPTIDELRILQALPLELKVARTKHRIKEWVKYWGIEGVYVSFSGGKDSTVLLHIVRELYPEVEAVFVDTGLEYPEIKQFVKTFDNVTILHPKMRFDEVIKKYGYPLISKEVAESIYYAKECIKSGGKKYSYRYQSIMGGKECGKRYDYSKYKDLMNVDFNISPLCCNEMKKKPIKNLKKKRFVASLAEESLLRRTAWLKTGCNAFDAKLPVSKPMSFWTEQDVLQYIKQNNLPIASVYGDIMYDTKQGQYDNLLFEDVGDLKCTGCQRTGCIFCLFGSHHDDRLVRLKKTHPKHYDYCMNGGGYDENGVWMPNEKGLGMKHIIDEVNKIYGDNFIKY